MDESCWVTVIDFVLVNLRWILLDYFTDSNWAVLLNHKSFANLGFVQPSGADLSKSYGNFY